MILRRRFVGGVLIVLIVLVNVFVWVSVLFPGESTLEVSFIDVGQGDGIFIKGPTGIEMIIDSGKDRSMIRGLGKRMGPFDRTIDLAVETHPDADHIGGFPEIFKNYQIAKFMSPGIPNDTVVERALDEAVAKEKGIQTIIAKRGMRIQLGGGAYADVLFPDRDESTQTETNDGSIVFRIVYGATSFMLTGDLPSPYEDHLVQLDGLALKSDVLKAGHHGSRFSTDDLWLANVHPSIVVISAGKDNTYGHPAPVVIDRIKEEGAKILSTIEEGTITLISDGVTIEQK